MLRFHAQAQLPPRVMQDKAFLLVSRNTYFGLHRRAEDLDRTEGLGPNTTKTTLVAFSNADHATHVSRAITDLQRDGGYYDRTLVGGARVHVAPRGKMGEHGSSLAPILVKAMSVREAQMLCMLNYFDMFLVFVIVHGSYDDFDLNCFEYKNKAYPSRPVLDRNLESMLRGDWGDRGAS